MNYKIVKYFFGIDAGIFYGIGDSLLIGIDGMNADCTFSIDADCLTLIV